MDQESKMNLSSMSQDNQMNVSFNKTSESDSEDQTNLIVNYLPETTTQQDLHKMFEGFGPIESCKLIRHKQLGHSLGYGFVKFKIHEHAKNAVNALNGLMMQNKKLKVSFARPANEPIKTANLYISGLKNTITEPELISIFSPFGKVLTVKVKNNDNDPVRTTAIGFVRFENYADAQRAVETMNGATPSVNPSPIHVSFAKQSNAAVAVPGGGVATGIGHLPPQAMAVSATAAATPAVAAGVKVPSPYVVPDSRFQGFGKSPTFMNKNIRFDPLSRAPMGRTIPNENLGYGTLLPGQTEQGYAIFVYNLSPEVEELHLWRLFGPYGAIRSVNIVYDKETQQSKGFAFVTMSNYEEAKSAIVNLHQTILEGKVIQVSFKKPKH